MREIENLLDRLAQTQSEDPLQIAPLLVEAATAAGKTVSAIWTASVYGSTRVRTSSMETDGARVWPDPQTVVHGATQVSIDLRQQWYAAGQPGFSAGSRAASDAWDDLRQGVYYAVDSSIGDAAAEEVDRLNSDLGGSFDTSSVISDLTSRLSDLVESLSEEGTEVTYDDDEISNLIENTILESSDDWWTSVDWPLEYTPSEALKAAFLKESQDNWIISGGRVYNAARLSEGGLASGTLRNHLARVIESPDRFNFDKPPPFDEGSPDRRKDYERIALDDSYEESGWETAAYWGTAHPELVDRVKQAIENDKRLIVEFEGTLAHGTVLFYQGYALVKAIIDVESFDNYDYDRHYDADFDTKVKETVAIDPSRVLEALTQDIPEILDNALEEVRYQLDESSEEVVRDYSYSWDQDADLNGLPFNVFRGDHDYFGETMSGSPYTFTFEFTSETEEKVKEIGPVAEDIYQRIKHGHYGKNVLCYIRVDGDPTYLNIPGATDEEKVKGRGWVIENIQADPVRYLNKYLGGIGKEKRQELYEAFGNSVSKQQIERQINRLYNLFKDWPTMAVSHLENAARTNRLDWILWTPATFQMDRWSINRATAEYYYENLPARLGYTQYPGKVLVFGNMINRPWIKQLTAQSKPAEPEQQEEEENQEGAKVGMMKDIRNFLAELDAPKPGEDLGLDALIDKLSKGIVKELSEHSEVLGDREEETISPDDVRDAISVTLDHLREGEDA